MTLNTEFEPADAHLILWRIEQSLMPKKTRKQREWEIAKATGNPMVLLIQDYDWADEVLQAQIGRKWLTPEFENLEALTTYKDNAMKNWYEAIHQLLPLSRHDEWWPAFLDTVRKNKHQE